MRYRKDLLCHCLVDSRGSGVVDIGVAIRLAGYEEEGYHSPPKGDATAMQHFRGRGGGRGSETRGAAMGQFQATVRILDVMEPDAPTARRTVEERLRKSGFRRWQLVYLAEQGRAVPMRRLGHPRRVPADPRLADAFGLLAILAWALVLLWLVAS